MDNYAIESFCDRWIAKAETYRSGALEDLFDRFFTLFVAYNRIYSAAAELHRASLATRQAIFLKGDRQEATIIMARLIGQHRFSNAAQENPAIFASCQDISALLQNRSFFLHSIRSTKQPDIVRNERLADGLHKHNLLAVLECLYQIRCNIFHGEKEFAPRQAELLTPAISLLEAVVSLSRRALHEIAHSQIPQ